MDINADVGEGCGYDAALMPFITSANVAAGYHVGSPDILRDTIQLAKRHDVKVGAHPGFRDPVNFGRRELPLTVAEVELLVRDTSFDPSLSLFAPPSSQLFAAGEAAGLTVCAEVFADRAYNRDGSLVPRHAPGAVIDDESVVVARAVLMATKGIVSAIDGAELRLKADTICVHGDTPGCDQLARKIHEALR